MARRPMSSVVGRDRSSFHCFAPPPCNMHLPASLEARMKNRSPNLPPIARVPAAQSWIDSSLASSTSHHLYWASDAALGPSVPRAVT